jgi:hypothetical protein
LKTKVLLTALIVLLTSPFIAAQSEYNFIPFRNGKLWGYCDTLGIVTVKPVYDSVTFFVYFQDNYKAGFVIRNKKKGMINKDAKEVIPPIYDDILSGTTNPVLKKGKLFGMANMDGKIIVPIQYDEVIQYSGPIIVKKNGKYGLYNKAGRLIAPLKYTDFQSVKNEDYEVYKNYLVGIIGEKRFLIHKETGETKAYAAKKEGDRDEILHSVEMAPAEYSGDIAFRDKVETLRQKMLAEYGADYIRFDGYTERGWIVIGKNRKYGLFDIGKNLLTIPVIYDSVVHVRKFDSTYNYVPRNRFYAVVKQGSRYGCIGEGNKEILEVKYDIVSPWSDNYYTTQLNGKMGVLTVNSPYPPIAPKYKSVAPFKSFYTNNTHRNFWLYLVRLQDGSWGYMGENGVEYFK